MFPLPTSALRRRLHEPRRGRETQPRLLIVYSSTSEQTRTVVEPPCQVVITFCLFRFFFPDSPPSPPPPPPPVNIRPRQSTTYAADGATETAIYLRTPTRYTQRLRYFCVCVCPLTAALYLQAKAATTTTVHSYSIRYMYTPKVRST